MKLKFNLQKFNDLKDYCGYRVWQKPKPLSVYAIGADVAEGVGGDASCAQVIDCTTGLHVASFWSNSIDVDTYSAELYKFGHYYNKAHICIEANNHGHAVIALMGGAVGSLAYPNLYKRVEYDEYNAKRNKVIGFRTTAATKPRLIENCKSGLKSGDITTFDKYTIQELSSYVRDVKTGKMGAKGRAKDDRVIALALAWEQANILKQGMMTVAQSSGPDIQYDPSTGFPIGQNSYEDTSYF